MATHVAARTRNLRIGMAVSLAAFYNPLRLAEEVAMIDVLSGGRVNWGAGRGFDRTEFEAVRGAGRRRAPTASASASRSCWPPGANERVSYQGRFWRYDGHRGAAQAAAGAAPAGVAGGDVPDSITRAAEKGYDILQIRTPRTPTSVASGRTTTMCCARTDSPPRARDSHRASARRWRLPTRRPTTWRGGRVVDGGVLRQSHQAAGPAAAALGARHRSGGALHERGRDPRHARPRARQDRRAARDDRARVPHVRPLSHQSFMLFTEKVLPKLL
jgi:hypothetical protein